MPLFDILLRLIAIAAGLLVIVYTIISAIRTFVLPRAENAWLTRQVYVTILRLFRLLTRNVKNYQRRDRILAFFSPVTLLTLPLVYLTLLTFGYTPIYWALGVGDMAESFLQSGSSLLTLGYAPVAENQIIVMLVSFSDAAIGLVVVALLIAYLPTIYAAFSEREKDVAMLETRAGSPPSAATMLVRVYRNRGDMAYLDQLWSRWEEWFAQIEENHTSLIALVFFRSPQSERSWITAAGAILDAASLMDAVVDEPRSVESVMMIRAGYLSLRYIADFFGIAYHPNPSPDDPISINRDEFDDVCEELAAGGIKLVDDLDQAWIDFKGWRVNYDRPLIALARLIDAPYAPWSSDRSLRDMEPIQRPRRHGKKVR